VAAMDVSTRIATLRLDGMAGLREKVESRGSITGEWGMLNAECRMTSAEWTVPHQRAAGFIPALSPDHHPYSAIWLKANS